MWCPELGLQNEKMLSKTEKCCTGKGLCWASQRQLLRVRDGLEGGRWIFEVLPETGNLAPEIELLWKPAAASTKVHVQQGRVRRDLVEVSEGSTEPRWAWTMWGFMAPRH